MKNSTVVLHITYAGILVRVVKFNGVEYVLLKTISDAVGVDWKNQRKKVLDSQWLRRRLGVIEADLLAETANSGGDIPTSSGVSGGDIPPSDSDFEGDITPLSAASGLPIYIRLDRVAAFLGTINPDRVRGAGNESSAEHLESKITEWDDALHDYEELGFAINLNHAKSQESLRKQRASFAQMIGVKNRTPSQKDRQALSMVIGQMANELGRVCCRFCPHRQRTGALSRSRASGTGGVSQAGGLRIRPGPRCVVLTRPAPSCAVLARCAPPRNNTGRGFFSRARGTLGLLI